MRGGKLGKRAYAAVCFRCPRGFTTTVEKKLQRDQKSTTLCVQAPAPSVLGDEAKIPRAPILFRELDVCVFGKDT